MNRYYVYAYVVDGVVRYIGKGSGSRVTQHSPRGKANLKRAAEAANKRIAELRDLKGLTA